MDDAAKFFLALISGGVITALITAFVNRKKTKADTAKILTDAAATLVKPLTERIDAMSAELTTIRKENTDKDTKITALQNELAAVKCQIDALLEAGEEKDKKINRLEAKVRLKDNRIKELEARVQELEAEVHRLSAENEKLRPPCDEPPAAAV